MKVLLVGDYSSFHRYLKEGLQELGVNVTLASAGDGWKKIGGADIILPSAKGNFYQQFKTLYLDPFKIVKDLKDYDVVQFINPLAFSVFVSNPIFNILKKQNNIVSYAACGTDYAFWESWKKGRFEYSPFDFDKISRDYYDYKNCRGFVRTFVEKSITPNFDIIIPMLYEYKIGYKNHPNAYHVIPQPINTKNIIYRNNIVKDKIFFFHGINREDFKGTPFIREAMTRLQNKYPSDVEILLDGHMPFDKYMDIITKANVVIDQCCGYGYGINACISMAQGRVVMAPAREETLQEFGINNCPIIHVKPDVDYIYNQMAGILERKNKITEIGYESRLYVESMHNYIEVAKQYIDAWKSTGKI